MAVAEGVELARTLVNEPPNVLYPESFAERAAGLKTLGVEVEILDEKAMSKLGMGALLGVGQGSKRDSRLVVMRWRGAKRARRPSRSPSSARASASTRAAFRSSPPPAWRT